MRSTTLRSSASSRLRSCAGRQLVVEDDDVDAAPRRTAAREHLDLAAAEERRGIRLRALLLHAQHDVGAGRGGEAGQLVERVFGIEMSGESLKRPTSAARSRAGRSAEREPHARITASDFSTRSHGDRAGATSAARAARRSTIVDGAPPARGPASSTRRRPSSSAAIDVAGATPRGGAPDRFALVAVMQKPSARRQRARDG